jgi:hypothetical protein
MKFYELDSVMKKTPTFASMLANVCRNAWKSTR